MECSAIETTTAAKLSNLRLDGLPPIYVLPAHLEDDELHEVEDKLAACGAPLTYDALEARIFIGKVQQKRRAEMELRSRGLATEAIDIAPSPLAEPTTANVRAVAAGRKRRRSSRGSRDNQSDSSTESESEQILDQPAVDAQNSSATQRGEILFSLNELADAVWVVKLAWLEEAFQSGILRTLRPQTVYAGKVTSRTLSSFPARLPSLATAKSLQHSKNTTTSQTSSILARAQSDTGGPSAPRLPASYASTTQHRTRHPTSSTHAALTHETTSEHDASLTASLPALPSWASSNTPYSCQRDTSLNPPNAHFINMLKSIRTARVLINDEIGVRAYSTAIASLSAYPYTLTHPHEISRLPGCSAKIAALYAEYANTPPGKERTTQAAQDVANDPKLKVLRTFYDIWGVGQHTAREFYNKGWRDLDDVIEYGWDDLMRVQQVGLKYYDEFLQPMPRAEVEGIDATVAKHAKRVISERNGSPDDIRTCIVGGYRRGKPQSGDADIIVSHLDPRMTLDLISPLVHSLSKAGWITHNLGTHTSGSRRGQGVLPWKGEGKIGGHGFDTLDKAMVVWQDPNFSSAVTTRGTVRAMYGI